MRQLTRCPTAAVLPRKNQFLCLTSKGWQISAYETNDLPEIASFVHGPGPVNDTPSPDSQPVGIRGLEVAANSRWYELLNGFGENNDKFWGYDDNILEAKEAFATGVEVYWPLLNLQQGYKTLPLFFHRLRLGTFVNVNAASDMISVDDTLFGAGFELLN